MKKLLLTLLLLATATLSMAQVSSLDVKNELITLAKVYRNFHFTTNPSGDASNQLNTIKAKDLQVSRAFISELIKSNNQIASRPYLSKPDAATLKYLFIIRSINWNLHEAEPKDNSGLIDSLMKENISKYELLSCYYGMIFTSVGNKNRPLNMAHINFTLNDYGLEDDTEKGIFFLESMNTFGMMIWGYMNVVKPPNYKAALEVITHHPLYNGQPYYQFLDLNFADFNLTLDKRKPKESYKKYHINKYLNTLLYHCYCLGQKNKYKDEQQKVMLSSILRNESYYKYSEHPETFQKIFQKVSQ